MRQQAWTKKHVTDLQRRGKIRGFHVHERKNKQIRDTAGNVVPLQQQISKEKQWLNWNLAFWANENALEILPEHHFAETPQAIALLGEPRAWRFDWCFPALMVAVEYEGIFSKKSRHTTIGGFTGDVEKYNAATALGWRVIRVTAVDYITILNQLKQYIP